MIMIKSNVFKFKTDLTYWPMILISHLFLDPCPPGSLLDYSGCIECRANSYSAGGQADSCTLCPTDAVSDAGSTTVGDCKFIIKVYYYNKFIITAIAEIYKRSLI